MIALLAIMLEKIGDAFLGALVGKVTDEVWTRLKGDPAKTALKQALGAAIQRYATSQLRLDLARPLLEKNGFLTLPAVANEMTQLVRFEREPNAELIGQQWKAELDDPPPWCDFMYEAKRLLGYLEVELRETEVFRPVFDAKRLDAIAAHATADTKSLAHIEAQLTDLTQLMDSRLGDLFRAFAASPIRGQILDYTSLITERTHDFVGRQFVFDAVTRFSETHPRGYYFIRGDPGIGKSALAAHMVKTNRYVHHFNIGAEGINTAEIFLRNICAQLIVAYQLNYTSLPPEATQDADFLKRLLKEVSDKLGSTGKAIVVVDALDEVDTTGLSKVVNLLYLPLTLPKGIYMILTVRSDYFIPLHIECEQDAFEIKHNLEDNVKDIRKYITHAVVRPGIHVYIAEQGIDDELFIEHLVEKSEGNFMYLHHVLPEIEHGAYTDLGLDALPAGLQNYYEDHWRRMGMTERPLPQKRIKIIYVLAAIKRPWPRALIANAVGVNELTVQEVLDDWGPFLHKRMIDSQLCYSFYHTSFREFLYRKDIVQAAGMDLGEIEGQIGLFLYKQSPWSDSVAPA